MWWMDHRAGLRFEEVWQLSAVIDKLIDGLTVHPEWLVEELEGVGVFGDSMCDLLS